MLSRLWFVTWGLASLSALGNGVLHYGHGARDAGAAAAFGPVSGDPLASMQNNPAALSVIEGNAWSFSLRSGFADGAYSKGGVRHDMDGTGIFPEFGVSWRPGQEAVTLGFSLAPVALASADWTYPDAAGGIGGISYGSALSHDSGFYSLRANAGLAWEIDDCWSVGASFGAVYSRIDFDAPFIFQTNPALAGAKVNLDLETDGWEPISEFGVLWRPNSRWSVGLRYRPRVDLDLNGEASADFSAQLPVLGLGGAPSYASYRARTGNALPEVAGGAVQWTAAEKLRLALRVDWIGWGGAFDDLDVSLSSGSNAAINGAIGSNPSDRVPVRWKDTWVVGIGMEYDVTDALTARCGWRWGEMPVSDRWVTPLNGSLFEHALAAGIGWQAEGWRVDFSYEYRFGPPAQVVASGYRSGEYSNSKLDLSAHVLGVGLTVDY